MAQLTEAEEIANLLSRYCHAIDSGNVDALEPLYAKQVRFEMGTNVVTGRKEILDFTRANIWTEGRHVTVNVAIEFTDGGANAKSDWYWIDGSLKIAHSGRYDDDFIREDGALRFAVRRIFFDSTNEANAVSE